MRVTSQLVQLQQGHYIQLILVFTATWTTLLNKGNIWIYAIEVIPKQSKISFKPEFIKQILKDSKNTKNQSSIGWQLGNFSKQTWLGQESKAPGSLLQHLYELWHQFTLEVHGADLKVQSLDTWKEAASAKRFTVH